jgi:hypothetical protein
MQKERSIDEKWAVTMTIEESKWLRTYQRIPQRRSTKTNTPMLVNEETIFSQYNVFFLPLHTRIPEKQVAAVDGVMGRRDDRFTCIFPQSGNSHAQCIAPVLEFYFIVCRDCQAIIALYASLELNSLSFDFVRARFCQSIYLDNFESVRE